MKKLLILVGLAALAYAPHALAQGFTTLAPIPGLTDMSPTSAINSDTLATFFNNLYKYLIGIAATLAVIEIIWGGLEYSTKDSVSKQSNGRERITQAIFGLILVLSPVLVFSIINPSILNLSINLPPIDLYVAPVVNTGTPIATGDVTAARAADCSVALTNGQVGCPTREAAQAFAASCSNGSGQVFTTNDASSPYGASCNAITSYQGNRNYSDRSQIPSEYWCFKTEDADKPNIIMYTCGMSKDACDNLSARPPLGGRVFAGCSNPPPN